MAPSDAARATTAAGGSDPQDAFPGGNCSSNITQKADVVQANVAGAISRIYRARRASACDHPALACGVTARYCLTLWRIDGAIRIIAEPRVGILYPWRDSDAWCSHAWRHWTRRNASAANAGQRKAVL